MSTIYTFHKEVTSLATPAAGDNVFTADISTNATDPTTKKATLTLLASGARGRSAADLVGFYGATPINQGTMTCTCLTAISTNPTVSATNSSGVWGFSSSTVALAYAARVPQMVVDLKALEAKLVSVGLIANT